MDRLHRQTSRARAILGAIDKEERGSHQRKEGEEDKEDKERREGKTREVLHCELSKRISIYYLFFKEQMKQTNSLSLATNPNVVIRKTQSPFFFQGDDLMIFRYLKWVVRTASQCCCVGGGGK